MKNITKVSTILDDLNITDNDVAYSLNKKARWNIPKVLKHFIATEQHDVRIDLIESHKLKRQSKCIGFFSTKGPVKKVLPKQHTYFNAKSISVHTTARKRRTTKRSKENLTTTVEKEDDTPRMTVHLLYPCPSTSSITHNPKYMQTKAFMMDDDPQSEDDTKPQNSKPVKTKRKKQRKRININGQGTRGLLEEYGCNDYDYEVDGFDEEEPSDRCIPTKLTVTVNDILDHAKKLQQLCLDKEKKLQSGDRSNVQRFQKIYIDKEETTSFKPPSEIDIGTVTTLMKPVSVFIPTADVSPEILQERYGQMYRECNCQPRKFIIDISKKVFTAISRSKAFRHVKIYERDMSAILVFAYDILNNLDTNNVDNFNVHLNMMTTCQTLQIETLMDHSVLSIDEVMERSITYIETIPIEYLYIKSCALTSSKDTDFQLLSSCYKAKTDNYHPKETFLRDIFSVTDEPTCTSKEKIAYDSFPPEFCNICFEIIDNKPATALQTCGHWFCDECWRDHFATKLGTGTCKVTCPEFDCKATMNKAVIVTIASLPLVEKLFHREQETIISSDNAKKWCPNAKCGRILTSTTAGKYVNVTCDCGFEICFDCLGPAHWPVPCSKTSTYWKKLSQGNDVNRMLFMDRLENVSTVRGKWCPTCNQFIEKQGGCFSMTCVCGTVFCWGCGKPYDGTHQHTAKCSQNIVGDNIDTIEKEIPQIPSRINNDSKLFKAAIKSRVSRHPTNTSHLKSQTYRICKKLKMLSRKYGNKFVGELENFEVVGQNDNNADKIKPFLASMLKIHSELLYIVEYVAVYLENEKHSPKLSQKMFVSHMASLEGLASCISSTISTGTKQELTSIIPNLMQLRFQSRKCISSLANKLSC